MRKMRRKFIMLAAFLMGMLFLVGCGANEVPLSYSDGVNDDGLYDSSLFFRNELLLENADPAMLYITEGEDAGYFYIYTTGVPIRAYRTKNFADFELTGAAFVPDKAAWSLSDYWAPEVIYNPDDGLYYMYYSAKSKEPVPAGSTNQWDNLRLSVAVSDNPKGPFREFEGERTIEDRNADGSIKKEDGETVWKTETLTKADYVFDFTQGPVGQAFLQDKSIKVMPAIDASPFFDEDGELYIYFVMHQSSIQDKNEVWGIHMHDMVTPDYDSLTCLTVPGKKTPVGEDISSEPACTINEGPFMSRHTSVRKDGTSVTKYYLTFSIYGYTQPQYSVCQAVGDEPLGTFVKLEQSQGSPLHSAMELENFSGTGHHSFAEADGEIYMAYHCHIDITNPTAGRALAFDKVNWVYNEELGYDVLHSNGPSKALQPVPTSASGYKNIAPEAVVSASGLSKDSKLSLINDGILSIVSNDAKYEARFEGTAAIELTFDTVRPVAAVMVYNSRDYDYAFSSIDKIVLETETGNFYAENILFPQEYISGNTILPGGSVVIRFKELKVKKITVKISQKFEDAGADYHGIALSDIMILGK